jgi:hypothetical protein
LFFVCSAKGEFAVQEAEQQAVKKREKKKEGDEISCLDDFPQTVLTALDKSGVPRELFAKHLDVLVNVLNFASKMKFSLAENRPSPVRDAATKVGVFFFFFLFFVSFVLGSEERPQSWRFARALQGYSLPWKRG